MSTGIKMHILLLVGVIAWQVGNFDFAASQVVSAQTKSLSDSLMNFTAKSFKFIAKNQDKNIIYSPLGAWAVLTMTSFGAVGRTWVQMRSALALPRDNINTLLGVESMIRNFSSFTDYELRLAIKIFISDDIRIYNSFIHFTTRVFKSSTERVNFSDPEEASRTINEWAAAKTNNRIKDLIDPDELESDTNLLLVNAVHFKGRWEHQFPSESRTLIPFHITGDDVVEVMAMSMYDDLVHGKLYNAKATFVKIPYKVTHGAEPLSMFVILPNEINGLARLVENFEQDFEELFRPRDERNIHLYLPTFTIESTTNLEESLIQMGSDDMFGATANFTAISNDGSLKVSKIAQKVFIDVNEAGSEAVAVESRNPIRQMVKKPGTIPFVVDHPFVCVIATDNRIPLFTAIITEPDSTPV